MMSDDDFGQGLLRQKTAVTDGGEPLLSRVYGALANQRRRYVLYYLRTHAEAQIDDLADQIVAWEQDISVTDVSAEDSDRVQTKLVHSHLPKLEDYGFVDYDPRTDTVCYTYPPSLLDQVVELAERIEDVQ